MARSAHAYVRGNTYKFYEWVDGSLSHSPTWKVFLATCNRESRAINALFEKQTISHLATSLQGRDENATVKALDGAYWVKGCSSLGRLRYTVLLDVGNDTLSGKDLCLVDIKEAVLAAAPHHAGSNMPREQGDRAQT